MRTAARLSRVIASLLSAAVLAGSGYGWFAYRTLGASITHVAGLPGGTAAAADPALSAADVTFTTFPTLGTPTIRDASGADVSIVAVDTVALPAFRASIEGPPAAYAKATASAAATVSVVNGTGQPGLAAAQAGGCAVSG